MLDGKRILLVISGGIAAYKSLDLIRRLRERGATVRCILTAGGARFITPLSVASLSGEKVYSDLFSLTDESEMGHIRLSREADLVVVAPATANLIGKMAQGLADDLASTTLLATDKPVLIAPSMNVEMWRKPAVQRNVAALIEDGVHQIGPDSGDLACGEEGPGRLAGVEDMVAAIDSILAVTTLQSRRPLPLAGRRALVTSGPTHEPIDPVRYLANRSSGRQGHAIAAALARLGAEVTLVSGPTGQPDPEGVAVVRVETAAEMSQACEAALSGDLAGDMAVDVAVCAAAVADWRAQAGSAEKLKKGAAEAVLSLVENEDILAGLAGRATGRPTLVVGFAAETGEVTARAAEKRLRKGCDWIVANDVSPETGIMGGETNTVHLITDSETESWPTMSKDAVAERLAARIAGYLSADSAEGAAVS